ncbi:iron ABC transporter permease [Halanaerobiaceae bacterium Z-7014]|uniref:Iron ABC transporter permease n=1 Tax=Halonatronomonas betaini TaxID=2778430 RepID=A0A931ATN0_9FIRM|nr:iron ABC transporter permease [Halonatronomonas betaini]MBF8436235.1 iron ABC transporter permease [Halonatronomonas betaini]
MTSNKLKQGFKNLIITFKKDPILSATIGLVATIVAVFILYPLVRVFIRSITVDGEFSFLQYIAIFSSARLRQAFTNSMILGLSVATTSTIVGFLAAYSLTKVTLPGKSLFKKIVMIPLISPPFMLSISIILLFGRRGLITSQLLGLRGYSIYGLDGLIIVQTLGLMPIAYRVIAGVLARISTELENAGLNLGANKFDVFRTITLPLALPGVASAWLLSFVMSIADFANPMVLGEGFNVLSVEAYIQITGRYNFARGAAFAILLLIPSLTAFLFQKYWVDKKSFVTVTGKPSGSQRDLASKPVKYALFIYMLFISSFAILLYATVIMGSFFRLWGIDYSLTLDHFQYAFRGGFGTIRRTIIMAVSSAPISGVLGMIIAFLVVRKNFIGRRALQFSSMLPFAVPGTVIGIGYVLAFNDGWIVMTGTIFIIITLLALRNMPVGIEAGVAALNQIDPSISEASKDLGANSAQTFSRITLPLLKPAILSGVSYSFVRAMTAVSAIIFVVSARWNHLTIQILQHTELMELGAASVLCLFLIVFVMIVFGILQKFLGEDNTSSYIT